MRKCPREWYATLALLGLGRETLADLVRTENTPGCSAIQTNPNAVTKAFPAPQPNHNSTHAAEGSNRIVWFQFNGGEIHPKLQIVLLSTSSSSCARVSEGRGKNPN
jgi:hypothetical protein